MTLSVCNSITDTRNTVQYRLAKLSNTINPNHNLRFSKRLWLILKHTLEHPEDKYFVGAYWMPDNTKICVNTTILSNFMKLKNNSITTNLRSLGFSITNEVDKRVDAFFAKGWKIRIPDGFIFSPFMKIDDIDNHWKNHREIKRNIVIKNEIKEKELDNKEKERPQIHIYEEEENIKYYIIKGKWNTFTNNKDIISKAFLFSYLENLVKNKEEKYQRDIMNIFYSFLSDYPENISFVEFSKFCNTFGFPEYAVNYIADLVEITEKIGSPFIDSILYGSNWSLSLKDSGELFLRISENSNLYRIAPGLNGVFSTIYNGTVVKSNSLKELIFDFFKLKQTSINEDQDFIIPFDIPYISGVYD